MEAWYAPLMRKAYDNALNSPDPSTQNGAVLVSADGKVIGEGCNHFPAGVDKCHWHGPKQAKYDRVVHAEVSAILSAARNGHSTWNSTLICPWAGCSNCSKHIADAGITQLIRNPWTDGLTGMHWFDDCMVGDEIMREAGVVLTDADPVVLPVVKIRRDGKLWPA